MPTGRRIEPFRVKVVKGELQERDDPGVYMSGPFYVNEDRSVFISQFLIKDKSIEKSPLNDLGFITDGFTLKEVNPTHYKMTSTGKIIPDSDAIVVSESGMTDYSKPDLQLPGLTDAIRKGRPGTR